MMLTLAGRQHATTTLKNTLASQAVKGEQDKDIRSSYLLLHRRWPERVHLYTHALAKIHLSCHEHRRKLPSIVCGAGAMCPLCGVRWTPLLDDVRRRGAVVRPVLTYM